VSRPRVRWRWNAYTRWRLLFAGLVLTQGGRCRHLPRRRAPELRRSCIRVELAELAYSPLAPANDVLPWGLA